MKNGQLGGYVVAVLAVVALAGLAVVGSVFAKPQKVIIGNLEVEFDGGFTPTAFSKTKPTPISFYAMGRLRTLDGTHPPAAREFKIQGDKHVTVDVKGIPVCQSGQLQSRTSAAARKACGPALIGSGETEAEVEFPEQRPIEVKSELLAFNGGVKGGVTTFYVHAFLNAPVTAAIVTTVKIKNIHKGRFGTESIGTIPKIAGGSGSGTYFRIKFKKGILRATCPDGHLNARASARFEDGTIASAGIIRPCTPKG
ncbi:MAG: hypothetical protein ACJ75T_11450 [Solirubrobacterales bacterium]